ncbi:MAG: hypothetical protein U5L10_05115 [Candidatus Moranbacteria bacterium]|nr:hypothetical protein [Candidatus Moranbacteria bacterium]
MKKKKTKAHQFKKNISIFLILLLFLAVWTLLVNNYGAQGLVELLGPANSYLVLALIALSGGLSAVTAPGFIAALATFAAGGMNPFLMGLTAGAALFLGDSLLYYFGFKGRKALFPYFEKYLKIISDFVEKKPLWLIRILVYLYFSFAPLPNDIVAIPLGLAGFKYRKFALPALLGNITFVTWVGLLFM